MSNAGSTPCRPEVRALLFACAALITNPANGADAASIPDLSGMWAREFLGWESPASGHGPIANRPRIPTGQSNLDELVGDYSDPILKPEAAAVLRRRGEISTSGKAFPDPSHQCGPMPMPYILHIMEIQILQQPDQITILYRHHHSWRRIHLNQSHPASVKPTWHGDSVGHYDGDTLIIDTVGVKTGPLSMADLLGTPQSDAVHIVERYRLIEYDEGVKAFARAGKDLIHVVPEIDLMAGEGIAIDPNYRGKALQLEFTVEDSKVLNGTWSARSTYQRSLYPFREWICAENTREYYSGRDTSVSHADTPDF